MPTAPDPDQTLETNLPSTTTPAATEAVSSDIPADAVEVLEADAEATVDPDAPTMGGSPWTPFPIVHDGTEAIIPAETPVGATTELLPPPDVRPAIVQEPPPPSPYKCYKCGTDLGYYVNLFYQQEESATHEDSIACWQPKCRALNLIDEDNERLRKAPLDVAVSLRKHGDEFAQRVPTGIETLDRVIGENPQNQTAGFRPGLVYLLTGNVAGRDLHDLGMQVALPARYDGPLVYIGLDRKREDTLAEMAARGVGVNDIGDGLIVAEAKHLNQLAGLLRAAQARLPLFVLVDLTWTKAPFGHLGAQAVARVLTETAKASFAVVLVLLPHRRDPEETVLQQGTDVVLGMFKPFSAEDMSPNGRLVACLRDRKKPNDVRETILERYLKGYDEASPWTHDNKHRLWTGRWAEPLPPPPPPPAALPPGDPDELDPHDPAAQVPETTSTEVQP